MARQKALSLLTALCGNSTFKDAAKAALTEAVAALVEYTGPPHPVYGDKPQQMLRDGPACRVHHTPPSYAHRQL